MPTARRSSNAPPTPVIRTRVTVELDSVAYRFLRSELEKHAEELAAAQERKKERTTVAMKMKRQWKEREDGVRQLLERI